MKTAVRSAGGAVTHCEMSRHKYKPQVLLGSDSHVMQWNPVLGIFRVNRYQKQFTLENKIEKFK